MTTLYFRHSCECRPCTSVIPANADRALPSFPRKRESSRLAFMSRQCPGHVLSHQRRRMLSVFAQRGHHTLAIWRIAQGNRQVAQPALVADPADRRTFGVAQEFLFSPVE